MTGDKHPMTQEEFLRRAAEIHDEWAKDAGFTVDPEYADTNMPGYAEGIADVSRLILLALDKLGIYPNGPEEREIEIHWPSPLPENLMEKLQEAQLKKELGVPREQILQELGYSEVREEE